MMPYLNSVGGLKMLMRFVSNWYTVLALFINLVGQVSVRFRDGEKVLITRKKKELVRKLSSAYGLSKKKSTWLQNSENFDIFYEGLYKRYLQTLGFHYSKNEHGTQVITNSGMKLQIIQPYSFVLDEVFNMKVYGEFDLHGRSVVDIGAALGDSSLYFANMGPEIIYAFESDRERYDLALENIALNNFKDKIVLYNELADSTRLSNLIKTKNIEKIFLKMDCEGCEYEIIKNMDAPTFSRILDIVLEYHGEADPLLERLKALNYSVARKNDFIRATRLQRE